MLSFYILNVLYDMTLVDFQFSLFSWLILTKSKLLWILFLIDSLPISVELSFFSFFGIWIVEWVNRMSWRTRWKIATFYSREEIFFSSSYTLSFLSYDAGNVVFLKKSINFTSNSYIRSLVNSLFGKKWRKIFISGLRSVC